MENSTVRSGLAAKRVRAILAGGAVLGVGAAITLASWNDSEFAKQTFTAGTFVFQGSTDGTVFTDHATAGTAAVLTAPLTGLTPNDVTYRLYSLKATGAAATVTPVAPTVADGAIPIATALTFTAVKITGTTCDATTYTGGTAVGSTLALVDGTQANLCLRVTAGPTLAQGATGTATWQWNAVSS